MKPRRLQRATILSMVTTSGVTRAAYLPSRSASLLPILPRMPIYEYRRPDGTTFEVLQKFSDDALTVDPDTGVPVQRVLSAPAIHFKGKGFHNTDYGTKNRNREKAAQESASKSEGGSSASTAASSGGDSASSSSTSSSTSGGSSSGSGGSSASGSGGSSSPGSAPASGSSGSSSS